MPTRGGVVLIIDDENGRATQALLGDSIQSIVRHPNDVTEAELKRAKLILVDYKLDDWPERESLHTPSLKPKDGIALIGVLRSNLTSANAHPAAFALNSGMLKALNGGSEWAGREHAIARSIDLEWVFGKGGKRSDFAASVRSLADAVAALPPSWPPSSKTKDRILSLLAAPSRVRWRQSVVEAIDRSQPPHEILIENSSGIALLRWMLHAVLPYPTFLLSERYLAARLRIDPASFSELLASREGERVRKALQQFEYRGVLRGFLGTRWWRAGIEYWIWQATAGRAFDHLALRDLVRSKISKRLTPVNLPSPVVTLDDHLRPSDHLIDLGTAVEIKPDGWPSFADSAWISANLANDAAFVALVPQNEKQRLAD